MHFEHMICRTPSNALSTHDMSHIQFPSKVISFITIFITETPLPHQCHQLVVSAEDPA